MDILIDRADRIDTLQYRLALHAIFPKDQIRLSVQVRALVAATEDPDQSALLARIHDALPDFAKSPWTLAQFERRILVQIATQADKYSALMKRTSRIRHVELCARGDDQERAPRSLKGAYRQHEADPFQIPEDFRLPVVASVMLASFVPV